MILYLREENAKLTTQLENFKMIVDGLKANQQAYQKKNRELMDRCIRQETAIIYNSDDAAAIQARQTICALGGEISKANWEINYLMNLINDLSDALEATVGEAFWDSSLGIRVTKVIK